MWHKLIHDLLGISETRLLGNSLVDWVGAAILVTVIWLLLLVVRKLVAARYRRFIGEEHPIAVRLLAYLVGHTRHVLFIAIALYAAEESLTFPPRIHVVANNIIFILLLIQVGIWAGRALQFYLAVRGARSGGADRQLTSSLDIVKFVGLVLIWSVVSLMALDNLGVNITALLAGLGVGGVAVALALQNVLGDLFASLAIALDKPFVVGDTLALDEYTGKVERIGIKTTRMRADSGEQIIFSNAELLKSRIRNFSPSKERRALMTFGIDQAMPVDKLQEIPGIVERIVRAEKHSRFERCHLKSIGDWAFVYEMSFYTRDLDARSILDLRQSVSLALLSELQARGIRLAIPVQRMVTVNSPPASAS